jgi:eukaryotic-like serine/threonine-protein kinase
VGLLAFAGPAPVGPPSHKVQELLRRRLDRLSPASRTVIEAAGILGLEFEPAALVDVAAVPVDRMHEALLDCLSAGLLSPGPGMSLRFNHALMRDAVLAGLGDPRRAELHLRAAAILRGSDTGQGAGAGPVAHHLREALTRGQGDALEAAQHSCKAALESQARFAWEEAVSHFELGWQICTRHRVGDAELRRALTCGMGDALVALSRRAEGVTAYEEAVGVIIEGEDDPDYPGTEARLGAARVYHKIAVAHVADRRFDQASPNFERSLALTGRPSDAWSPSHWHQWIATQLARADSLYHVALLDELDSLLASLGQDVEAHGEPAQRADLLAARVMARLRRDRYRPGTEVRDWARAELGTRLLEDPHGPELCGAYFRLGFVLLLLDDHQEARVNLEAARRTAALIGDRIAEAKAAVYLSHSLRRSGSVHGVRGAATAAEELAERASLPGYAAAARCDLAWAVLREGHPLEAREQATRALAAWAPDFSWPFEWLARFPLARVAAERGRFEEAGLHFEQMLRPGQHLLPERLAGQMGQAIRAGRMGRSEAEASFGSVLAAAAEANYA